MRRSAPHNRRPHTLVVGGTRGNGRAVALVMAQAGHAVSVIGRRGEMAGRPRAVRVWLADLAKVETLPAVATDILRVNGPLQSLVFAQRFRGQGDSWQSELDVSLTATHKLIELLQTRFAPGQSNAIVIIVSVAARFVTGDQPASYHAVKGALRQLARYYARALGPKGIRVNCVSPGIVLKPEVMRFFRLNPDLVALYERIAPLRRFGTAAEVASVVRFLCSPEASFVTGQDIVVDGGISLAWQGSLARELVPLKVRQPG